MTTRSRTPLALSCAAVLLLAGCGGTTSPAPATVVPASATASTATAEAPTASAPTQTVSPTETAPATASASPLPTTADPATAPVATSAVPTSTSRPRPTATTSAPATSEPATSRPTRTATATSAPTAPAAPETSQGCGSAAIVPVRMSVPALGLNVPVLAQGVTAAGNVAAPPHGALMTAGWYRGSVRPGSGRGHVVMTAHTTVRSGRAALGNVLTARLSPGMQIRLSDASGRTVCFRYSGRAKIWVKSYRAGSTVWINNGGPARIALLTCDDYNARTGNFDSRWVLYASQSR